MNCQDFQNEFEAADSLTQVATQHSQNCADCRDFQMAQSRVSELLQGLQRVEAPKDFDFQVRARIARQKEKDRAVPFFSSLRYILPFASVLLVISALAIGGLFVIKNGEGERADSDSVPAPQNAQVQPAQELSALPQPANSFVEANSPVPEIAQKIEEKPVPQKSLTNSSQHKVDEGGGSRDLAVTSLPPVIQPEFNSNRAIEVLPDPNRTAVRSLTEVLKISGINAENGKVVSVAKNSLAERSGVQIGDAIEAVNGRKIDSGEISGDQISIRTITVVRNGESVEIILKN